MMVVVAVNRYGSSHGLDHKPAVDFWKVVGCSERPREQVVERFKAHRVDVVRAFARMFTTAVGWSASGATRLLGHGSVKARLLFGLPRADR
eukprot:5185026-Prymnesium_polylepis.2